MQAVERLSTAAADTYPVFLYSIPFGTVCCTQCKAAVLFDGHVRNTYNTLPPKRWDFLDQMGLKFIYSRICMLIFSIFMHFTRAWGNTKFRLIKLELNKLPN